MGSRMQQSEQLMHESKPATKWLTKTDSVWQALLVFSAIGFTLLNPLPKYRFEIPKIYINFQR